MSIYVFGSLAFDRIMSFPGKFDEHIFPDKLHILNVSFYIEDLVEKRGGTAGNIAYSLALLGERPRILATVGKDFSDYAAVLTDLGLPLEGIRVLQDKLTAGCYLITDRSNNQINGFHPAAMSESCLADLGSAAPDKDWAIISPGNIDDMRTLPRRFREAGVPYIFDPGQQIPTLSGAELLDAIQGSAILVSNDYELEMICRSTGRSKAEIRALTGCLITTLGEKGSLVDSGQAPPLALPAAKLRQVADPTGAGDAFRSGLLKGLLLGFELPHAARLGATCASFCVECNGTQEHRFTCAEFTARHRESFGEDPGFVWSENLANAPGERNS